MRRLLRLRGVGNKTRRVIATAVRILRQRLGSRAEAPAISSLDEEPTTGQRLDPGSLSIDLLARRLVPRAKADGSDRSAALIAALLGLSDAIEGPWPSQADVAEWAKVTRARVSQVAGQFQARWAREPAVTKLRADIQGFLEAAGGVMLVQELAEALIVARGSTEDEPRRSRLARAVLRAAVEVERAMGAPRFQPRRDGRRVLVALTQDLAGYAFRLGELADRLAEEDPLVPPQRVLQRLREVPAPGGSPPLADSRLIRLAAAVSTRAALSSRQELYPRGMDPARALKLSQGALHGVASLTVQEIRDRVRSRYSEAAPLPDRPALDGLLVEAGFELQWDPTLKGVGAYVGRLHEPFSVSSRTESAVRQTTGTVPTDAGDLAPEVADARLFEERLRRGLKEGSFYTLLVSPKDFQRACHELCARFPVERVDFEELFLRALRQVVEKAGAKWEAVVNADACPGDGKWNKLMVLVRRAMPLVEAELRAFRKPMLLVHAGLLARYDQMDLLERLRDSVGRPDGVAGLWLLVPGDHRPLIDGKLVPILSPGQRARIPESWIENRHRSDGNDPGQRAAHPGQRHPA
jgi:hypothetical protein